MEEGLPKLLEFALSIWKFYAPMSTPTEAAAPDAGFEPELFWEEHGRKFILAGVLLVLALVSYAIYEFTTRQRTEAAGALLATGAKPEDYRKLIDTYPGTVAAGNAHLLLANLLRDESKFDEAAALLRSFTEKYPKHPLIHAGWLSLAESLATQGKAEEALGTYGQIPAKFPESHSAPLAMIEQANLLRSQGKTDEARRAYENLVAQYPRSLFAQEATREMRLLRK